MLYPSNWTQEYSLDNTLSILRDLALGHLNRLSDPPKDLIHALTERDWLKVIDFEVDYRNSLESVREVRQALAFFSKLEPIDLGLDKEKLAFEKFESAENSCRETNRRLRSMRSANGLNLQSEIASVLHGAQRKIARMLGPVPALERLNYSFGPGANTTVNARRSSPRFKLGATLACSTELVGFAGNLLAEAPLWAGIHAVDESDEAWYLPIQIDTGRLQFVPKSAKIYRSIDIQPIVNSFAQKGIGTFLRGRLARIGVDLSDQTRNQQLARQGSEDGRLATVDLSSASDTISIEVVAELLPLDWFSFLSNFRVGKTEYQDRVLTLEKFSSMGNAFTFELETTLFWGLAMATCEFLQLSTENVSVYGDDIIIPVDAFFLLKEVFEHLGFTINRTKSFVDGPFRESCGADWLLGHDVRPYYQKKLITAETLFTLHNFYMRRFDLAAAAVVRGYIHQSLQIFGPDGYGDGHLIGSYDHRPHKNTISHGYCGVTFDTFTHKKKRNFAKSKGDYVLPAYSIYQSSHEDPVDHWVVRGSIGYRRISIYTLRLGIFF